MDVALGLGNFVSLKEHSVIFPQRRAAILNEVKQMIDGRWRESDS